MRYEIKFGDDSIGRSLKDGEVVVLEYLTTQGSAANDTTKLTFRGIIEDSNSRRYAANTIDVDVTTSAYGGSDPESVESIKYNAPRFYSAQYRAVTAQDYAVLTKKVYDNAKSVVAYGGDSLNPPIYGKVYIA